MGGSCGTLGEKEKHIPGFDGKPEGKRPTGRFCLDGRIILK
jgi:hypothetical protein